MPARQALLLIATRQSEACSVVNAGPENRRWIEGLSMCAVGNCGCYGNAIVSAEWA
jgi:hypothetical protein